jgi:nitrogen fixation NifU-like protein
MLRAFHDLVTDEAAEAPRTLGDLRMMQGVRKFPQRVKCAMLAWRAVEQALQQSTGEATISTDTDFAVPRYRDVTDSPAPIGKNAG